MFSPDLSAPAVWIRLLWVNRGPDRLCYFDVTRSHSPQPDDMLLSKSNDDRPHQVSLFVVSLGTVGVTVVAIDAGLRNGEIR